MRSPLFTAYLHQAVSAHAASLSQSTHIPVPWPPTNDQNPKSNVQRPMSEGQIDNLQFSIVNIQFPSFHTHFGPRLPFHLHFPRKNNHITKTPHSHYWLRSVDRKPDTIRKAGIFCWEYILHLFGGSTVETKLGFCIVRNRDCWLMYIFCQGKSKKGKTHYKKEDKSIVVFLRIKSLTGFTERTEKSENFVCAVSARGAGWGRTSASNCYDYQKLINLVDFNA